MPDPIPALPDTERRTSYSVTTSTVGPFDVGFDIYADSTDFQNWVEVWVNGAKYAYNSVEYPWSVDSPSGTLSALARPITDGRVTFTHPLPGTVGTPIAVQIVGARRPRRASQFGNMVAPRDLNQVVTDLEAALREGWDLRDRLLRMPAGETIDAIPAPSDRANKVIGFNDNGDLIYPAVGDISALLIDEDDMASASATKAPTERSVKNFVETNALSTSISLKTGGAFVTPSIYTIPQWFTQKGVPWTAGGSTGGVKPGNGDVAADTAAMQNLVSDMGAKGGAILIPENYETNGLWLINDTVTVSGKQMFKLAGTGASRIGAITGFEAGALFDVTLDTDFGNFNKQAQFLDFALTAYSNVGGTGIKVRLPSGNGRVNRALIMRNVHIVPLNSASTSVCWANCLVLNGGIYNGIIDGCSFRGLSSAGHEIDTVAGIVCDDDVEAGANFNVDIQVTNTEFYNMEYGYFTDQHTEGMRFRGCTFVANDYAVFANQPSGVHLVLDGVHSSNRKGFVSAVNVADVFVRGCAVQKREGSTDDYADIFLSGCNRVQVIGNSFILNDMAVTAVDGLVLATTTGANTGVTFAANRLSSRRFGVWIKDGTAGNENGKVRVFGNDWGESADSDEVTTPLQVDEDNTTSLATYRFFGNSRSSSVNLPDGTATPVVTKYEDGIILNVANTLAVTYTDFTGAHVGKILYLHWISPDPGSVVQHSGGGNIFLNGSANFTGSVGDILVLQFNGSRWDEISRKVV